MTFSFPLAGPCRKQVSRDAMKDPELPDVHEDETTSWNPWGIPDQQSNRCCCPHCAVVSHAILPHQPKFVTCKKKKRKRKKEGTIIILYNAMNPPAGTSGKVHGLVDSRWDWLVCVCYVVRHFGVVCLIFHLWFGSWLVASIVLVTGLTIACLVL